MPDLVWQKSSFSGSDAGQECVELASELSPGTLLLRESDAPDVVIRTTPTVLHRLLHATRTGALTGAKAGEAREPGR